MFQIQSKPFYPILFLLLLLPLHGTLAQSPIQHDPPTVPQGQFDSSMAIVIGALAASFLFLALFSIFLRRCADLYIVELGNPEWQCYCSNGGIHPKLLQTFPIIYFSAIKDLRICKGEDGESLECAVCLAEFSEQDTLRLLPHCNHVFHPPCIDAWLTSHVTCPVCRADLTTDPHQVSILVAPQLNDEEDIVDDSENRVEEKHRAEQSGAGGDGEIEGCSVARDASEGQGNVEENKGVWEFGSKSKLVGKGKWRVFERSNSTGHSLVEEGECVERYTLRLPEDVRKYILQNYVAMQRSKSLNVSGSSRKRLFWSDSEGSSGGGKRIIFGMRGQGRV